MTEYENLLWKINSSYKTCFVLKLFSYIGTVMSIVVFGYLLVFFIEKTFIELLGFLITLGVPFVFVSIVRRLIDAKRPYEIFDFYESPPKKKAGRFIPQSTRIFNFCYRNALPFRLSCGWLYHAGLRCAYVYCPRVARHTFYP